MDVWRAAGVGNGPYGAKRVFAVSSRQRAAAALEPNVAPCLPIIGMAIMPVSVALPDLDAGADNRVARSIEGPPHYVRDLALRPRRLALHDDEIVVHVTGPFDRIEWSFRRAWRENGALFCAGQPSRDESRGRSCDKRADDLAAPQLRGRDDTWRPPWVDSVECPAPVTFLV